MPQIPELLLPVGNMDMCLAAIHSGADAIYVGAPEFNARGRSKDHSFEELKEIIDLCHLYEVRVHVAFNILIFESEMNEALGLFVKLIDLGVDAFIVQDLGLARRMRELCPEAELHASTQMTVTGHEAMEFLKELRFSRFILGREVSLKEIQKIREKTNEPLEVFVHGALCVAYSGQCFTSEGLGGRSANRGQCAQSCRLDYELFVDGVKKELGDKKYLVSPQDLCGIDEVGELKRLGVNSLKVEGRLKSPQYVAQCGLSYRQALEESLSSSAAKKEKEKLGLTYSRGLFSGWLHGVDHQKLVGATYSEHRGLLLGQVSKVDKRSLTLKKTVDLKKGDGLLFVDKKNREVGARIWECAEEKGEWRLSFSSDFNLSRVQVGMDVYQTSAPELHKNLGQILTDKTRQKRIGVICELRLQIGQVAQVKWQTQHEEIFFEGEELVQKAQKRPSTDEMIGQELSSLGGSVYELVDLKIERAGPVELFISQQELKRLRQKAVSELNSARLKVKSLRVLSPEVKKEKVLRAPNSESARLNILLRDKKHLPVIKEILAERGDAQLGAVILDFEYGRLYDESVALLKSWGVRTGVATTRILKPAEYSGLALIERARPDEVLVRNLGALNYFLKKAERPHLRGDFSLNVANSATADFLQEKGLDLLCPSYDLNEKELLALIFGSSRAQFEVTLHQYLPLFHMEHCVFAAFLSKGSSYKDCGRPCEKHQVEMRDAYGGQHFLHADQECRNTMFQGKAQSGLSLTPKLLDLGVREFRLEALNESAHELKEKILLYLQFLDGNNHQQNILERLGMVEHYGVAPGQLLTRDEYVDRKKV